MIASAKFAQTQGDSILIGVGGTAGCFSVFSDYKTVAVPALPKSFLLPTSKQQIANSTTLNFRPTPQPLLSK